MSSETKKQLEEIKNIDTSKVAADIEKDSQQSDIVTLPTGYRVRFRSVASDLIRKVQQEIKDPIVPTVPHPDDNERLIENPMHPDYIEALRETRQKRADAAVKVTMLRGVELVDGLPEDDEWLDDLVFLGVVSEKDIENATEKLKEVWFKQYVVVDKRGIDLLNEKMGLTEEVVAQARKSFQRN